MRALATVGIVTSVSATFIFLMVVLKLPIFALLYIVWWAIHATPEPEPVTDEDGGTSKPLAPRPRPRRIRGPHCRATRAAARTAPRRWRHRRACARSSPARAASSTSTSRARLPGI